MGKLPHLALLFVLSLFAACTCDSAKIENKTDEPIFVSQIDEFRGGTYEDFGDLVLPGDSVSIPIYGEGSIRARDMRGKTVFYSPLADEDSAFKVTSLRPLRDAEPLGSPNIDELGADGPWSLSKCHDGDGLTIPLFGLLATIKNESPNGLIVAVDKYPGERVHDWKYGVFAAPGQTVQVFEHVTEEPYVRAFDQEGRLVYMEPLPRTERPNVVILPTLPSDSPVRPGSPYDDDCGGIAGLTGSDLLTLAFAVAILGAFGAGALVALFMTVRFFWRFFAGQRVS